MAHVCTNWSFDGSAEPAKRMHALSAGRQTWFLTVQEILAAVRGYDGVVELAPVAGSEHPEIS